MAQTKVRSKQQIEVNSDVSFAGFKLTNLANPVSDTDAVNKLYVDSIKQSLDIKDSCRVSTVGTESYTIVSGAVTIIAGTIVDGVSIVAGDRILIKNAPLATGSGSTTNTTQPANGIYKVDSVSTNIAVSRSIDANVSIDVTAGMFTFISEGTANSDSGFVLSTNDSVVLNTTPLTFVQFSGAGQIIAGNGLNKIGNTISVLPDPASNTIAVSPSGVSLATLSIGTSVTNQLKRFDYDNYGRITSQANATLSDIVTTIGSIATQNYVFASPIGGSGSASFRALVAGDIPSLDISKITSGILGATLGGTGFGSYAIGDLLYAGTTTALAKLNAVATGNVLISGGVGTAPSWGKVGLTTHVTGTLPIANGGTGISTAPTNGQLLIGNAGAFTLGTLSNGSGILPIAIGAGTISIAVNTTTILQKSDYIVREVPTGSINGTNATFTLAGTPSSGKEMVFVNGILLNAGASNDYTISTNTISFNAGAIPQTGDILLVTYIK